ncbi:MAG: peptidoglycan-binding domain-containing protein [bacterium]
MPPERTYDTKKIILFGIIILLIVAGIGFLIFRKINSSKPPTDQTNLFPYDGSTTPPGITGSGTSTGTIENPVSETTLASTTAERLRIIANYPVTGLYAFLQNKVTTEPKFDELTKQTVSVSRTTPINRVRFNAKQNGFLVEAEMTKNLITISQKTNTPIPNSEEIWFGNKGSAITYRSWDATNKTIATFSGTIPSPTSINYCQKPFTTILAKKSKGDEVKELQKYVNAKLSLNLTVDGAYGTKLVNAIKPLQQVLALTPTGKYDQELINTINTDCTNIIAALIQKTAGVQKVTGDFIEPGIIRGDVSPDGTQLFYLKPSASGGVVGIITDSVGKNPKQVFSSPFTEWKPQWVNATTIALTTLASSEADGYMYFLNPTTGDFQKVIGPVRGLTTLVNPSASTVLMSSSANKRFSLATYTVATGTTNPRDLSTLPAKCTWQNDTVVFCAVPQEISSGQYPDDWYQGLVTFNDSFWSIDITQNSTTNIVSPSQKFDARDLLVSPDGAYLYFINKIDGTLWSYRMDQD